MKKLQVTVSKILGTCTSTPPMEKGDFFTVDNGDIRVPAGRFVCAWALQNILPLLPAKERKIAERRKDDWMWRVHHVQCPDPAGRVVFRIEKVRDRKAVNAETNADPSARGKAASRSISVPAAEILAAKTAGGDPRAARETGAGASPHRVTGPIRPLRIVVDEVRGTCTSGHKPGDAFFLDGCRLTIPRGGHFCLYAVQAVLPFVAAKARRLEAGDWLADEFRFICPDPAGNVILRVELL